MSYDLSNRWSVGGTNGTLIVPDLWLPELEMDLPVYDFWNQFMARNVETMQGEGNVMHVSYIQDTPVATTPLTAGTPIAMTDSTGLAQTDVTIREYGHTEPIENLQAFFSNSNVRGAAALSVARNAVRTRNTLIGNVFAASTNYFTIEGTLASNVVETSGTTASGTSQLLPIHVQAMVSALRRKGIPTFRDGYYRCIGAPGMFDGLKGQAQVYSSAAELGLSSLHVMGEIRTYNGVIFIEESGADAVTTLGANNKSVLFGAAPVVGWDDFLRKELISYYADDKNDFGRLGKIGYTARFGASLTCTKSTNARAWVIYSGA